MMSSGTIMTRCLIATIILATVAQLQALAASVPELPAFAKRNIVKRVDGEEPFRSFDSALDSSNEAPQTRKYDLTISRAELAPDGFEKRGFVINGQFPGPMIEANWHDKLVITVTNNITAPEEGTSLHWHGILQKGTPWADGVSAITQCPIPPGQSYTYEFVADQYGTTWYHAHYSGQLADGLIGPIVIHGPRHVKYDVDVGPILLNDWFHKDYITNVRGLLSRPIVPPASQSNLINGKTFPNCSGPVEQCGSLSSLSQFRFRTGKTHLIRLVNSGSDGIEQFSIDSHTLKVVAVDMTPIKPYDTKVLTLGPGQRAHVLVEATGNTGDKYWMRATFSPGCSFTQQPYGLAVVLYDGAEGDDLPSSTAQPVANNTSCMSDPIDKLQPIKVSSLGGEPSTTTTLKFSFHPNATNTSLYFVNENSYRARFSEPLLPLAVESKLEPYRLDWNIYNYGTNSSVRVILQNLVPAPHVMHLHGYNFWVLAEGSGTWDGHITNPSNPIRRDTIIMNGGTPNQPQYAVIEFEADNPGMWSLHCHLASHLSLGMLVNFLTQPAELSSMEIPQETTQNCRNWVDYIARSGSGDVEDGRRLVKYLS